MWCLPMPGNGNGVKFMLIHVTCVLQSFVCGEDWAEWKATLEGRDEGQSHSWTEERSDFTLFGLQRGFIVYKRV